MDYRKSNKERRNRTVAKAGFSTEAEYLAYLMQPDVSAGSPAAAALFAHNTPKVEEKPTIHNVYIIDISGSMGGARIKAAMAGVNGELDLLKKDDAVNYTQTIVEFSGYDHIRCNMYKVPIKEVGTFKTSVVGSTALNQAIGETIERLRTDQKKDSEGNYEKVLVKIFTDGGENDSQGIYSPYKGGNQVISRLISTSEGEGFTVTFVGTEQDVKYVVNNLHVDFSNTLSHDNTERGIGQSFLLSAGATVEYAAKVLRKEDVKRGFYKTIKTK